jgi:undecaprenyl-diphosphatase
MHTPLPTYFVASCLALFTTLWCLVAAIPDITDADRGVVLDVRHMTFDPFVDHERAFTQLGSATWVFGIAAVVAAALLAGRYFVEAGCLVVSVVGTKLLIALVKVIADRPRPQLNPAKPPSDYSFPSGHSASSLALFASLALLFAHRLPRRAQFAIWSVAALLVFAVGTSRIYLGVHYPTDVAAGWLLAAAFVAGVWTLLLRQFGFRFSMRDLLARRGEQSA